MRGRATRYVLRMKPAYVNGNVRAVCPECGVPTTFEAQSAARSYGSFVRSGNYVDLTSEVPNKQQYPRRIFVLLQCAGCGRGGMAELAAGSSVTDGVLLSFLPSALIRAKLPKDVPAEIESEVREAERCAAAGAHRAASAMLRSALEKVLKKNGYDEGNLKKNIDKAADEGLLTASRKERAHTEVRDLGNDVLHDAWREVTAEEAQSAHHYVQRVIEDFYDDRPTVEATMTAKGRKYV